MSIDEATPEEWDTVTALNNLSVRKKKPDPVERPDHYNKGGVRFCFKKDCRVQGSVFEGPACGEDHCAGGHRCPCKLIEHPAFFFDIPTAQCRVGQAALVEIEDPV